MMLRFRKQRGLDFGLSPKGIGDFSHEENLKECFLTW
jgi:hypothetical protein